MNKKAEIAALAAKASKMDPAAYGNACARRNQMVDEGTPKRDAVDISATWFRSIIAGTYKSQAQSPLLVRHPETDEMVAPHFDREGYALDAEGYRI